MFHWRFTFIGLWWGRGNGRILQFPHANANGRININPNTNINSNGNPNLNANRRADGDRQRDSLAYDDAHTSPQCHSQTDHAP